MRTATAVAHRTATVPPATAAPTAPARRTRTARDLRTQMSMVAAPRTTITVELLTPTHTAAPRQARPVTARHTRTPTVRPRTIPLTPTTDIILQLRTTVTIRPRRLIHPVTTVVRLRAHPPLALWSAWPPEQP